ncbi:MAG: hypothetical protein KF830_03685 [Planctomycetes bacterium]|nr:hypothetical protein [Planctomycetota bacterium]
MNRLRTGILVGVVSAVGVLLLAVSAAERKSPGRVSTVHGRIAEIAGGEACSACHGGWFGSMRRSCTGCHADVAGQIERADGLHGRLAAPLAADCTNCHSEHHGGDFRLVNALAFSLAGVPDVAQFDHRLVGFEMAGVHLTLDCTRCHPHAEAELVPEGQKRFLGLSRDCASCHDDPHQGRMQVGCATCHGQDSFAERSVPAHEEWLSLRGAHAGADCRTCHPADTPQALERLRPGAHQSGRQCADCHATPHSEPFVAGNARLAGVPRAAVCRECHPLDLPRFTDLRASITPAQHAHGGFPLAAPHDEVVCAGCHAPWQGYAERHPGRAPRDCAACHEDPHAGQFAGGPFAAGCTACHAATHFAPPLFDRGQHERTALPLTGRHTEIDCHECHTDPGDEGARRFRGTPSRCEQCHADAHAGRFAHASTRLAAVPQGACAACHGTTAFAHVDHQAFDHAAWTEFPIDGAHAQIDCADCHRPQPAPDATGRRFGRVPRHGDGFGGCATCHGDPHQGAFDGPNAPANVDGRTGCERCHDSVSFRVLPHGFDHGAFTGFPLQGAHAKLDCSACHARLPAADAVGRTWARAAGGGCADCHSDPHRGQFERLGRVDCSRCHKSANSFATLSFRHNLDSRFPLSEAHAKVACSSCHKPEPIEGVPVVRYRPLPTECVDCHGNEDGGAAGRRRRQ